MPTQEQVLRMAMKFANAYIEEHGYEGLGERSFDELVDSFNAIVEENHEQLCFE